MLKRTRAVERKAEESKAGRNRSSDLFLGRERDRGAEARKARVARRAESRTAIWTRMRPAQSVSAEGCQWRWDGKVVAVES